VRSLISSVRARSPRASRLAAMFIGALLAVGAPKIYAQMRMGVVDVNRALQETDQGRRARNQIKALFQKRQEELDGRQRALKTLHDQLEKDQNSTDRETLERRMQDYQRQFVEMEQNYLQYQQEIAQRQAELTKQILINLQEIIREIGQRESYTIIFEQAGVVWSQPQLDLTDRVVQVYNQQHPVREGGGGSRSSGAGAGGSGGGNTNTGGGGGTRRPANNPPARGQ
jgi:outer membrane protein